MVLASAEDLGGGLKEPQRCLDLPLGSPNNPVIRLRALRVEVLGWSDCCLGLFVLSGMGSRMRSSISPLYSVMGLDL